MEGPNDLALLMRVQGGDQEALSELYRRYSRVVYSIARRVLQSQEGAEDVLQEIFMQIWRSPEPFMSFKGGFAGWLAVVSRNRSIDLLRQRRWMDPVEEIEPPSKFDLADAAETTLMCEKARRLISLLPEPQKEALSLAFFNGMTQQEIAEALHCPLGTIKTRIRAALGSLRKGLDALGAER